MRVFGSVIEEESGRPLEGLLVRVFDKDLIRDDRLGVTRTNADGQFELSYTEAQYRDLNETLPDLYLRVYDASGEKLLHTTEREVRWNASVAERFEIRIPRARISGA
jgi:carotenoid cleavage dioxygenase